MHARVFFCKTKNCAGVLFVIFLISSGYYIFSFNDELHPSNISGGIEHRVEWETSANSSEEIAFADAIFEMPFVYLDEGGQSYVFSSIDQKYVLKLFKFKRFRPNPFIKSLPPIFPFKYYRDRHIAKRQKKLIAAFTGHKLAYDLHKKESRLIWVQLNPLNQPKWITLIDKKKNEVKINLEKTSYVLQERGEMLSANLSKVLDQGGMSIAKQRIDQILSLYLSEYGKGIYDLDRGIMHNIGCIEGTLFHLDVGKFMADQQIKQSRFYQKDLAIVMLQLQKWISQNYPQYSQELAEYINKSFSKIVEANINFN